MNEKIVSLLLGTLVVVLVIGGLLWAFQSYLELPVVKFSATQHKVVAVENFKGEMLPLSPLPEKYEKIYVE